MKVNFKDIPSDGLTVTANQSKDWVATMLTGLHESAFQDFSCHLSFAPLHGSPKAGGVWVTGSFQGHVSVPCDRCAESFPLDVKDSKVQSLVRVHGGERREGEEDDDENVHWVTTPFIDLGDLLREYVALALPLRRLCRPDCRGLCATCGANLNTAPCACG